MRAVVLILAFALAACGNTNNGRLQGWVEADFVFVGPDEAGRVEALGVREGDKVAAGAPLFVVDAELQQADVQTASAQVAERARGSRGWRPRSSARKRSRCCRRRRSARSPPSRSRPPISIASSSLPPRASPRRRSSTSRKANSNRDKAALEEVRRQITVAQMASRDEDIAAARQSLAAAQARQSAAETKLARRKGVARHRHGAAGLLPAGRDGAGRAAGGLDPAARQHQGAFLRRRDDAAEGRARRHGQVTCDGCAP